MSDEVIHVITDLAPSESLDFNDEEIQTDGKRVSRDFLSPNGFGYSFSRRSSLRSSITSLDSSAIRTRSEFHLKVSLRFFKTLLG